MTSPADLSAKLGTLLIDQCDEILLAVDPANLAIVAANGSACRRLGYPRQQLIGMSIAAIECNLTGTVFWQGVTPKSLPEASRVETEFLHADGSFLPVERTVRAVALADKAYLLVSTQDILELKSAEEKLANAMSRLKSILESTADGILALDTNGHVVGMNHTFSRMWDLREDTLASGDRDVLQQLVDTAADSPALRAFFDADTATSEEIRSHVVELANGKVLELKSTPQMVAYSVAGRVYSCSDITERKQTEEKLHLAASVFTHAREGIIITDADATIVEVNDTFTRITGYSREEALGQNPRMLKSGRQPPEYYAAMWQSLVEKGHWSGEAWNRRKDGEVYAEMLTISAVRDENGAIQNYVALFSDITSIKAQQQQLEHIAHYDALTNLPNRVLLSDRLQQAMAHSQRRHLSLAVAYLDLDGFKAVNDRYSHDIGDELLIAIAKRMKESLRDGDTLARIGGDEFVAVMVDLEHQNDYEPVLARLLQAAAAPTTVGEAELQVSASIGVTLYPQDTSEADQLLRHADQAMYQAKQAGKNRYHLFDVALDAAVQTQRESLEHIRRALEQREFTLYYQPKVNMKSGEVIGAEALIRWHHQELGLLLPAAFLPIIEVHPISVELGEWVIDTALTQMAAWHAAGLEIPVSVNVGARQLLQKDFVTRLAALLAAHPTVEPSRLELEIVETSALEDMAQVSQLMRACREIGVRFALDDFGTGYSSLTYLKRLPAELLKIDQSFVRDMLDDPEDLAIVEGVVGLATAFRREVIAEGVETVAHGELLLPLGCNLGQGYGIARPMPGEALPAWVAKWRPDPAWVAWRECPPSRDDLAVVFAEVEHRHWLRAIETFLAGDRDAPPTLDEHDCHFGRWHKTEGRERYGEDPEFQLVIATHDNLHALGWELIALHARGKQAEAQARLGELHRLRDELVVRMRNLARGGKN